MARPRAPEPRGQVSVGMDDDLRGQLEAAARISVRSLSGEIVHRLLQSLESSPRKRGAAEI